MPPTRLRHGHCTRTKRSRTFRAWEAAKQRCFNPNDLRYADWGGRGITMCAAWRDDFAVFLADMGECPPGLTIERTDTNGDYEPGNCCWATMRDQQRNRRNNRLITYDGALVTVAEAAERIGLKPATIYARLAAGWTDAEATNPTLMRSRYDRRNRTA